MLYHEISKQLFERHVRYIKKYWDIVSLDDVVEQINRKHHLKNSVVITFDDGWKSNCTEVLPVIKKYNITVTLYLTSDIVGSEKEFWWVTVENLQRLAKDSGMTVQGFDYYTSMPNKQKDAEICEAINKFQYTVQNRCALSVSEIREMRDSGLVTLGSHSKNHPCLTMMSAKEAEEQIVDSKNDLESKFDVKINHFAFPNGDYNKAHIKMLVKAGYLSAVTTVSCLNTVKTSPYELGRLSVSPNESAYTLALQISGFWKALIAKGKKYSQTQ